MSWSLKYNDKHQSLADWHIARLKRTCINQGNDRVSFTHQGASIDSDDLFLPESQLTIFKDDCPWFRGIVVRTPSMGSPTQESKTYELAGPWWYLENLVFQQHWNQVTSVTDKSVSLEKVSSSRIVLGQGTNGKSITTGDQIKEILKYATAHGAPFQLGNIGVNTHFPYDETKDLSCAEAIQRLLRWTPDAVVWLDYTTDPLPTLNITRRNDMPQKDIPIGALGSIKDLKISPRHDLQSSAVVLKYEKNHNANGKVWTTTELDAYPANATGSEFKALVLTIELDGMRLQHVTQSVKTHPITESNAQWWQQHLPGLENIPSSKITIKDATRKTSLPSELIEGAIAPWMNRDVEEDIVRAKLSYETDGECVVDREVAVRLYATNAATRTYQKVLADSPSEATPVGLAKQLYEAISPLTFDGELTLQSREIPTTPLLGHTLNITGARDTWADMSAVIQSIREDVDSGRTVIKFGPPRHLGPDDLVELLRVNRRRVSPRNAHRRVTGHSSKAHVLEQATHSRVDNSNSGPGHYRRLVFVNPHNPNRKVIVDAAEIDQDTTIQFQEEDVCENGVLKKRIILASQPYTKG